ncbi:MAG: ROK family protein [Lactococcus sp.]
MKKYIAIDIGGTSIKYGLVDSQAQIVSTDEMDTQADKGGPAILEKIISIIERFMAENNDIAGVGISSAGMIDPVKGEVFYSGPQIPNYIGTQFKAVIEDKFNLPCEIENDVNCAGLAEAISGSAKDSKVALCLTIGTGIGGALLLNSTIYSGFSYSACEVGYIRISDGAFQDLASTTALVNRAAELHIDDVSSWNGYRIFEEAKQGDSLCIQAIDQMINYLAEGIANICYVANPEVIVLGGGIMAQKEYLETKIDKALRKNLVSSLADVTKVKFAHYQNQAGMLGAYYNFKIRQQID